MTEQFLPIFTFTKNSFALTKHRCPLRRATRGTPIDDKIIRLGWREEWLNESRGRWSGTAYKHCVDGGKTLLHPRFGALISLRLTSEPWVYTKQQNDSIAIHCCSGIFLLHSFPSPRTPFLPPWFSPMSTSSKAV